MKVVDMFGSALPVCAFDYPCLHELVKHNVNGVVFKDEIDLGGCIYELAQRGSTKLKSLQEGVKTECQERWQEQWDKAVAPLFSPLEAQHHPSRLFLVKYALLILLLGYIGTYFITT